MHRTDIADSIVRATARPEPGPDDSPRWSWVEAAVWTDRMLAALDNGVRGGKWHSLIDKVYEPLTLRAAWLRVKANQGAAGVDRMSIECFEANAQRYLAELAQGLPEGSYQPEPVYPKGQWANSTVRHCDGQGPDCADGLKVGIGTYLRKGVLSGELWLSTGEKL
jgi:hypothetical protein